MRYLKLEAARRHILFANTVGVKPSDRDREAMAKFAYKQSQVEELNFEGAQVVEDPNLIETTEMAMTAAEVIFKDENDQEARA